MKSRVLLILVVLAIVFSIVSIVSDVGMRQVTGATSIGLIDLPLTFSFLVIVLLIVIIMFIILDLTPLKKQL